jgi:hypothetical protein
MKLNMTSVLYAAGIAGVAAGILSVVPLVNFVNCLLCGWLWVGGGAAVYLYNNREKVSLDSGNGFLLGAIAGVIAAVIIAVGSAIGFAGVSVSDPEFAPYLDQIGVGAAAVAGFSLICSAAFSIVFGGLGGLIGASIFKKK